MKGYAMRPINQGEKPGKHVTQHREYFDDIKTRIGCYCSYCERRMPDRELHIEHVRPQNASKEYRLCWHNLLLACFTCNSHKDKCDAAIRNVNDLNIDEYAFPHIYDTYHLIDYPSPTYMPVCSPMAEAEYKLKVEKLFRLLQMDNSDGRTEEELLEENGIPSLRISAGINASELRKDLDNNPTNEAIASAQKKIAREIERFGFWSIWMKEFEGVQAIRDFLLDIIPGTEKRYFGTQEEHASCEHDHKYNDIIGILKHRKAYKERVGKIEGDDAWMVGIANAISNRLPDMLPSEQERINELINDRKDKGI